MYVPFCLSHTINVLHGGFRGSTCTKSIRHGARWSLMIIIITVYPAAYRVFFSRPPAAYRVFFSRPYIRPPIACVRSFTCVRVRSLKSHNMGTDADVHARTHTYGHGRRRTCTNAHAWARTQTYMHVRGRTRTLRSYN